MTDRKHIMKEIGYMCKHFREHIGYSQSEVAEDTGYSVQNISSFETGRTNNMLLLLWYVDHGLFCTGYTEYKYKLNRILRGGK